jgi:hypothetical protein
MVLRQRQMRAVLLLGVALAPVQAFIGVSSVAVAARWQTHAACSKSSITMVSTEDTTREASINGFAAAVSVCTPIYLMFAQPTHFWYFGIFDTLDMRCIARIFH